MNKKFKRMLATVSAIATCAVSVVSTSAGAMAIGIKGDKYPNQYTTSFTVIGDDRDIKYTFWQAGTDYYGNPDYFKVFISEPITKIDSSTGEETTLYRTMFVHTYMIGDGNGGKASHTDVCSGWSVNSFASFSSITGDVNEDRMPLVEEYLLKNSIPYTIENRNIDLYGDVNITSICFDNKNMTPDEIAELATKIRKYADWSFEDMALPDSTDMIEITDMEISLPEPTLIGDANEDGEVNISDAVLIMQSITNPSEYSLTIQGIANADVADNDGITLLDALRIQEMQVGK